MQKTIEARPKFRCRTVLMKKPKRHRWCDSFDNWIKAPAFFVNPRGLLIHRVHSACTVLWHDVPSHGGVSYLCGNQVTFDLEDAKDAFVADPPKERFICLRCEEAAKRLLMPSADDLAGRHVHRGVLVPMQVCCTQRAK